MKIEFLKSEKQKNKIRREPAGLPALPADLLAYRIGRGGFVDMRAAVSVLMPVLREIERGHAAAETFPALIPGHVGIEERRFTVKPAAKEYRGVIYPGYSPPEVYTGVTLGAPSDVYAFCALLYFMITGFPPENAFVRMQADQPLFSEQLRRMIGEARSAYVRDLVPEEDPFAIETPGEAGVPVIPDDMIDDSFIEILETGMAVDAEKRFAGMAALLAALSPYHTRASVVYPVLTPADEAQFYTNLIVSKKVYYPIRFSKDGAAAKKERPEEGSPPAPEIGAEMDAEVAAATPESGEAVEPDLEKEAEAAGEVKPETDGETEAEVDIGTETEAASEAEDEAATPESEGVPDEGFDGEEIAAEAAGTVEMAGEADPEMAGAPEIEPEVGAGMEAEAAAAEAAGTVGMAGGTESEMAGAPEIETEAEAGVEAGAASEIAGEAVTPESEGVPDEVFDGVEVEPESEVDIEMEAKAVSEIVSEAATLESEGVPDGGFDGAEIAAEAAGTVGMAGEAEPEMIGAPEIETEAEAGVEAGAESKIAGEAATPESEGVPDEGFDGAEIAAEAAGTVGMAGGTEPEMAGAPEIETETGARMEAESESRIAGEAEDRVAAPETGAGSGKEAVAEAGAETGVEAPESVPRAEEAPKEPRRTTEQDLLMRIIALQQSSFSSGGIESRRETVSQNRAEPARREVSPGDVVGGIFSALMAGSDALAQIPGRPGNPGDEPGLKEKLQKLLAADEKEKDGGQPL